VIYGSSGAYPVPAAMTGVYTAFISWARMERCDMRLCLISYFDVSESYGLGDDSFLPERLAPGYDLSEVGIANPLGRGVLVDLQRDYPDLMSEWTEAALSQVDRPESEIGHHSNAGITRAQFGDRVKIAISRPISHCRLVILAVGVALLRLEFSEGIPVDLMRGVGRCYEYAAYTPAISAGLQSAAQQSARNAVRDMMRNRLIELTSRSKATVSGDSKGYEESSLLTTAGFTSVLVCIDVGDLEIADQAARSFELGDPAPDEVVNFEFHGSLRFDWATCLVEARGLAEWTGNIETGQETPEQAVGRMLACIEIAHTFLGACEAFTSLFDAEMHAQVGAYARATLGGRSSQDLNRLRTLALALVSLTNFDLVTPTEEDQQYFRLFEKSAKIGKKQGFIQEACEILYNVQEAEFQWQQDRRDRILAYFLAGLTSLTLVSVMADSYNFIGGQNAALISSRVERLELLAAVGILGILFILLLTRPSFRRRKRM
jgi:hypothetical protein